MPPSPAETAPGIQETAQSSEPELHLALVLLWSRKEPERAGEAFLFTNGETRVMGRGAAEVAAEEFAHLSPQTPGLPLPIRPRTPYLQGDSISGVQLGLTARRAGFEMNVGGRVSVARRDVLEMDVVGRCVTLANGQECRKAFLVPNDTVLLRGEALFMCVLRPLVIPSPGEGYVLHPFGDADEGGSVGESLAMWTVRRQVWLAAASDDDTLVRGESGTGKEAVSRSIHGGSRRSKLLLVTINAAVFTDTLVESKLFGHRANYPNPGTPAMKGLIAEADGTTLFMDEIGDCPLAVQAQLLRVIAAGECQQLGESLVRYVNIRFIGATCRGDERFREDFLNRFPRQIWVPPLRERREDIPLLIRHILRLQAATDARYERFLERRPDGALYPRVSGRLVDFLARHDLRGNVRELAALVVTAAEASPGDTVEMFASGTVPAANVPPPVLAPAPPAITDAKPKARRAASLPSAAELTAALERNGGNVAKAAEDLGIARSTGFALVRKYGLKPGGPTPPPADQP